MRLALTLTIVLFIFILSSCTKDKKDTQPPIITFTTPTNGQSFVFLLDSTSGKYHIPINVTGNVSDNIHLTSVYIILTDMNHTPVQDAYKLSVTSASLTINNTYDVTEFRLQTGQYIMQITADDGYNSVSSFQPINITESPTQWLGYCVNLRSAPQTITGYDSLKHINLTRTINGTYNGMKYGSYYQQLYVNGNANQPFTAYDIKTNTPAYTEILTGTQTAFTCMHTDGRKAYVGFKNGITDGTIYSYLNTGAPSTSYRFTSSTISFPYYFTTTSTNNVAVYKNVSAPGGDNLVTFGGAGASFNNSLLPVNMKSVSSIIEKSQDSLYVFGNDINDNATAYIYTFSSNGFLTPPIFSNTFGKLLSAVKVNNQYVIFSTESGVYACKGTSVNSNPILTGVVQKLAYQPKINMLTTAEMGSLNAYTVGTNSLSILNARSMAFSGDSIVDFEVITNK